MVNEFGEATADTEMQLRLDDIGWMRLNQLSGPDANDLKPADRESLVRRARMYFQQDGPCRRGVLIYTSYAIGRGFSLKARKSDADTETGIREIDPVIQKLADAFWKSQDNRKLFSVIGQQKASNQLLHDGEIFFALYPPADPESTTIVRRLPDALEIRHVLTNPEDYEEVWYYHRTYTPIGGRTKHVLIPDVTLRAKYPDGGYPSVAPEVMKALGIPDGTPISDNMFLYHATYGSTGMRGIPMIGTAMGWSKAHKEFIEDRIAINRALARFSWMRKVKGAAASVMKFAGGQPNAGPNDLSRVPFNQPAGGVMTTNQAVDWSPVNAQTGGTSASVEARMIFLQVCRSMGLPEHFLSDGGNGNRATATEMDRPTQLNFQDYQNLWKEAYEAMFAFEMFEQGYEYDPDIVDVQAPPVLEEDAVKLSTAIVQLAQVMPELKVSEFYRRALESLNIEDAQDILPEIEKRADDIQQQQQDMQKQTLAAKMPITPGNRTNGAASASSDNKQS